MSAPKGLVTDEGVDEGSAASAAEGTAAGPARGGAGSGDAGSGDGDPGADVVGEPPHGAPVEEGDAAEPVDMESAESRRVRAEQGTGQQLQEGEG